MNKNSKISIAGHRGLVGSAIHRNLLAKGYANSVLRTHAELDLENQAAVHAIFEAERPEYGAKKLLFLGSPRRASCWTSAACTRSGGGTSTRCTRGSSRRIGIASRSSLRTKTTCTNRNCS